MIAQPSIAETGLALLDSEVAWCDSEFFHNRRRQAGLPRLSDNCLNAFIADSCSVLSLPQSQDNSVNFPVQTGGLRQFSRPASFGRVAIVPTEIGPLEVKGIGVRPDCVPAPDRHGTGLLTLTGAISEICTEAVIRNILNRECKAQTVRCVALILTDLNMKPGNKSGESTPCALLVREHVPRFHPPLEYVKVVENVLIFLQGCEDALRHYGITSAFTDTNARGVCVNGERVLQWRGIDCPTAITQAAQQAADRFSIDWDTEWDLINLQACLEPTERRLKLVDFGAFEYRAQFRNPALNAMMGRLAEPETRMVWGRDGAFCSEADGFRYQGIASTAQSLSSPRKRPDLRLDWLRSVPLTASEKLNADPHNRHTKALAERVTRRLNHRPRSEWAKEVKRLILDITGPSVETASNEHTQ